MKPSIVIVDYGMGNLRSVQKAFEHCGAETKVSGNASEVKKADKIVLPGVGAFGQAMRELKQRKLIGVLTDKVRSHTPYLGLCLGLQLLFSSSEEGNVKGLGLLAGRVKRFSAAKRRPGFKIPHMGWNTLSLQRKNCPLMKGVDAGDYFYFVHSYVAVPEDKEIIQSVTRYGADFCSSVWQGSLFATQFHPEKSQRAGLNLIKNFIAYEPAGASC